MQASKVAEPHSTHLHLVGGRSLAGASAANFRPLVLLFTLPPSSASDTRGVWLEWASGMQRQGRPTNDLIYLPLVSLSSSARSRESAFGLRLRPLNSCYAFKRSSSSLSLSQPSRVLASEASDRLL